MRLIRDSFSDICRQLYLFSCTFPYLYLVLRNNHAEGYALLCFHIIVVMECGAQLAHSEGPRLGHSLRCNHSHVYFSPVLLLPDHHGRKRSAVRRTHTGL